MPPPYIRAITVAVKNFDYWKNAPLDNSLQLLLLTRLLIQSNRVGARTRILCAGAGAGLEGREGGSSALFLENGAELLSGTASPVQAFVEGGYRNKYIVDIETSTL